MRAKAKAVLLKILLYLPLTLVAVYMMVPFVWMLSTSFKPMDEIFTIPPIIISKNMGPEGYEYIFEHGAHISLAVTFFLAISRTLTSLLFCSLAGYGFAKLKFPGRGKLFSFLLATMIVPGSVTMVPVYVIMTKLKWIDTFQSLIVPGAANAFGIFFMRQYISTVNDELLDAGRIDGCSELALFTRVILPIIRPGLVSLGLIFFMAGWNDFLGPLLYLKSPDKWTLPLFIQMMTGPSGYTIYRELMAAAVLSVTPLLIIFLIFQRRVTEGITAGAVKG